MSPTLQIAMLAHILEQWNRKKISTFQTRASDLARNPIRGVLRHSRALDTIESYPGLRQSSHDLIGPDTTTTKFNKRNLDQSITARSVCGAVWSRETHLGNGVWNCAVGVSRLTVRFPCGQRRIICFCLRLESRSLQNSLGFDWPSLSCTRVKSRPERFWKGSDKGILRAGAKGHVRKLARIAKLHTPSLNNRHHRLGLG